MMEQAMSEFVNRMGIVNLGPVLNGVGDRMRELTMFLRIPRSLVSVIFL